MEAELNVDFYACLMLLLLHFSPAVLPMRATVAHANVSDDGLAAECHADQRATQRGRGAAAIRALR